MLSKSWMQFVVMKYIREIDLSSYADSYEKLEAIIRKHLSRTRLSYREVAAIVGSSHTQLWSFHKQHCKLQFDVLDRLALLFREPYLLTNSSPSTDTETCFGVEDLIASVRETLDVVTAAGISYRKIGEKTGISHEWVRCFHVKQAKIEVRKLLLLADYIGVPYELNNADSLAQKPD